MVKENRAEAFLDKFYNTIFKVNECYPYGHRVRDIGQPSAFVSKIVVSDCAVIFVDNKDMDPDKLRDLKHILVAVSRINRRLINKENENTPQLMTACAIDYGWFKYVDKTEDDHVEKSFFYGQTYVNAYLQSKKLKNKEGFCRVMTRDLTIPENLRKEIPFRQLKNQHRYFEFHWMVEQPELLAGFHNDYKNIPAKMYDAKAALLLRAAQETIREDWRN